MNLSFWTDPWHSPTTWWLVTAVVFTSISCGIPGTFLVLRRMSLTGDAISHSVLPGIVIGFLVSGSLDSPWIILGAALSGWITVMIIDVISRKTGVREDTATGVVFTAMFSIGVVLMRVFAAKIDLDPDCVLFGSLETAVHGSRTIIGAWHVPNIAVTTGFAAVATILFVVAIYHRLLATSFDPVLSRLTGQATAWTNSLLLGITAAAVVTAFQSVGAIMSVALLVVPASTSLLVVKRLPLVLTGVLVHSFFAAIVGIYIATWANCNLGASVILAGAGFFLVTLTFHKWGK